ncbi:hypothetical protein F4813DRAFT_400509 [Daldinia decipiens]|uniref:uncharacterized protein n=1 Tax=Daldinia decipiens TaxID=326647 RepID=UPI0020C53CF4|nr:uncharacterized protein F4813DRAFT_400509 [Daldinia decipiens]KAI1652925.1 hypothetical protein F4813DRAFT_400509 [Daldinia decipiens]
MFWLSHSLKHSINPTTAKIWIRFVDDWTMFHYLLGAGAPAVANLLADRIGIGWTDTLVAFLWIPFSPLLCAVMRFGPKWRAKAHDKANGKAERKMEKKAAVDIEVGMRKETGLPQENDEIY